MKNLERDYDIYVSLCQDSGTPYVDFEQWAISQGYEIDFAAGAAADLGYVTSPSVRVISNMPFSLTH
jgi:hypothetical protein